MFEFSSTNLPIISVVAGAPMEVKLDIAILPKTFSNSPTVDPSDLLIDKFLASLYSPFGTYTRVKILIHFPLKECIFNSQPFNFSDFIHLDLPLIT